MLGDGSERRADGRGERGVEERMGRVIVVVEADEGAGGPEARGGSVVWDAMCGLKHCREQLSRG